VHFRRLKAGVWKADAEEEVDQMLEPAMLIGLSAVAIWTYFRYPRLRPGSLVVAATHVAISFLGFALLPLVLHELLPLLPAPAEAPYVVLALLIPTLTYVLLSWVWLIGRVMHELFRGPRGGHPVANEH
jgi:hypothetical protein